MSELIAWIVLFILWGCETKIDYQIDGQEHSFVINPKKEDK